MDKWTDRITMPTVLSCIALKTRTLPWQHRLHHYPRPLSYCQLQLLSSLLVY